MWEESTGCVCPTQKTLEGKTAARSDARGKRSDGAGCQSAAGLSEPAVNPSERHRRTKRWHHFFDTRG